MKIIDVKSERTKRLSGKGVLINTVTQQREGIDYTNNPSKITVQPFWVLSKLYTTGWTDLFKVNDYLYRSYNAKHNIFVDIIVTKYKLLIKCNTRTEFKNLGYCDTILGVNIVKATEFPELEEFMLQFKKPLKTMNNGNSIFETTT